MSCGNSDILALIDYFQNGTDLSNNDWDNYNYYDLWNAIENGTTPPNRTVCATFVQADIRSIVFAVLGVFTSPSDYLGDNIDFYYLYLKAIGQEVVSPKFSNFCIGQLYDIFSIGLTAKFRQPQGFNVTMSKVAAIASITFEQGQQLDVLLSKSADLQQVVFQQQQTFNAELAAGFTGLLDDYPNAAAAYSVRLLSSTYSGALVRIRRANDNSEEDFYPDSNNELSLNSGDGGGTTLGSWIGINDGYIVTWYDQSGNSRDASQAVSSQQAKILNGGSFITVNAKPALDFTIDNTQEVASSIPSSSNYSLFSVLSSTDTQAIPYNNTPNGSGSYFSWWQNGSTSNPNSGVGTPSYYYDSLLINPSNTQTLYNNYATGNQEFQQVVNLDFSTWSNFVFGGWGSSGYAFTGYFQEIVLYDSDQTSNISGIYANQSNYF